MGSAAVHFRSRCGPFTVLIRLAVLPSLLAASLAHSQGPDLGFGDRGIVTSAIRVPLSYGFYSVHLAVDASGRVTLASHAITRLLADGSVDPSFASHGYLSPGPLEEVHHVRVDRAGRQLAVVGSRNGTFVLRLLPSGVPDKGFGTMGRLALDATWVTGLYEDAHERLVVLADGKLLRFQSNGRPDESFGQQGQALAYGHRLAPGAAGRILVLLGPSVTAYLTDGSLDTAYGLGGTRTIHALTGDPNTTFVSLPDGSAFVSARVPHPIFPGRTQSALARLTPDGQLDSRFGANGVASYDLDFSILAVDGKGRLLLLGEQGVTELGVVVRLLESGYFDTTFGQRGVARISEPGTSGRLLTLTEAPGGGLLAAGQISLCERERAYVARLTEDGTLDPRFGMNGLVTTDFALTEPVTDSVRSLVAAGGGSLLAAYPGSPLVTVARHRRDGTLDPAFGRDGLADIRFGGCPSRLAPNLPMPGLAHAVTLDSQGRFVAFGGRGTHSAVAFRFRADGSPDSSFGTGGSTDLEGLGHFAARADGGIVLLCRSEPGLARVRALLPDGMPDIDFGAGGFLDLPLDPVGLALDPSGRILVAGLGLAPGSSVYTFALARLTPAGTLDPCLRRERSRLRLAWLDARAANRPRALAGGSHLPRGLDSAGRASNRHRRVRPDGKLDDSFGTAGQLEILLPYARSFPRGALVQPDGKLVVFGSSRTMLHYDEALALRLMPDGTPDSSFGPGGRLRTLNPRGGLLYGYFQTAVVPEPGRLVFGGRVNLAGPDVGYGEPALVAYAVTTPVSLVRFTAE